MSGLRIIIVRTVIKKSGQDRQDRAEESFQVPIIVRGSLRVRMKWKNLGYRWQFAVLWVKMSKGLCKKAAVCRNIGADTLIGTGMQNILKKTENLFFHIKRKFASVKRKAREPVKCAG